MSCRCYQHTRAIRKMQRTRVSQVHSNKMLKRLIVLHNAIAEWSLKAYLCCSWALARTNLCKPNKSVLITPTLVMTSSCEEQSTIACHWSKWDLLKLSEKIVDAIPLNDGDTCQRSFSFAWPIVIRNCCNQYELVLDQLHCLSNKHKL